MYGYICQNCGAHLDPGERCECLDEKEQQQQKIVEISQMITVDRNGQMKLLFEEAV